MSKSEVGNETKAATKAAIMSAASAGYNKGAGHGGGNEANMAGAVAELHKQHPHDCEAKGPFHNDMSHVRHERLGGLKKG